MASFFSNLAKKIVPMLVEPTDETPTDEIRHIWEIISQASLDKDENTLYDIHNALVELKHQLIDAFGTENESEIFTYLAEQKILSNLVSYSIDDNPQGYSDEVIMFFLEFTKGTLMNYLISPNFYSAINLLLQNAQPHNYEYWNNLIVNLFAYIIANQEVMELFVKPNYSPLLEQYAKLVVSNVHDQPEQFLQLFSYCNSIQLFNQFYSTNQVLQKLIIDFISECITTHTTDSTKTDILLTISNSIEIMSQDIANKFNQMFYDLIVKRFVSITDQKTSISNSIYILVNLPAKNVVLPIFDYMSKKLPQFILSDDDEISYFSFRLSTLLLEYANPRLHEKYSGRVSSDFTNLLRANWFVNTDTTEILEVVRINVAKSELQEGVVNWDIEELLLSVKKILIDLLDKEEKVFCACIEFVTELATNRDNCVSFYTLSSECENGIYNSIKELCLTVARRIGNRPSTVDQLKQAYSKLSENNYEDDSEGLLFRKIVLIIEFLKELNAISNVKNSFRMSYLG